jgi:hypothetical protein
MHPPWTKNEAKAPNDINPAECQHAVKQNNRNNNEPRTDKRSRRFATHVLWSFERARTRRRTSRTARPAYAARAVPYNQKHRNNNNKERLGDVLRRRNLDAPRKPTRHSMHPAWK